MADGYARVTGRVGVCSVHQGPGLTNTVTGLAEAAKSRTPVLVLSGETPAAALTSNFRIDQHDLVESVGAIAERVHSPPTAADDAQRAYQRAVIERRPVVLMLPDRHPAAAARRRPSPPSPRSRRSKPPRPTAPRSRPPPTCSLEARRPAIIAGRGAVLADARDDLEGLGQLTGALLATSAPANGLFAGLPYSLGISGGFASPLAAELLPQADAVLVVGASVNHWTTKHGALIASPGEGRPARHRRARDRPQPARRRGRARRRPGRRAGADRRARSAAATPTPVSGAPSWPSGSPPGAGPTSPTTTPAPTSGSTRGR